PLRRPGSLRFAVYRNRDAAHPRRKHRRILVRARQAETERLSYVGDNFSSGVMASDALCRYFVGVLDKDSGQMEVYNAEIFNMQPLLNVSTILPLCNEDADKPEDVYKFEDILSPAEYEALQAPAAAFVNITAEEIAKKTEDKSHCSFVLEELKFLPTDEKSRDHKARCLWFLDTLIKFSYLKVIKKKYPMGPECPHIISRKLMKNFTSLTYNNGSVQNLISASMKTKITAYVIALALHINNFQTDLTVLQNDMKLQESRMTDIARAMRLKISKVKGLLGLENDHNHKLGTLSLPLPVQKASGNQQKRKKMN
uniref:RNA polymerase I subunit E n=1 Tax=Strix occidentalis caurina TaxID=311401 RepID=A0A8D0FLL4_STROC